MTNWWRSERDHTIDCVPSISARVIARKLAERGGKTLFLLYFQLSRINSSGNVWFEGERREMSSPSRRAWRANFTSRERRLDTRTRQVLGGCTGVKNAPPPKKKAYGPIAYNSSQDWPWSVSQVFSLGIQVRKTFLSPLIQRAVSPIKKSNKFTFGTPWLPIIYYFRHQNEISVADAQMSFLAKRSFRQVAWRDCCYLKPTGNSGQKPCFSKSLKHLY